jgi:hypothetical protein
MVRRRFLLFHHDFELRSSLLTLGRVDASITLHSLNRNLGAILDVDATLGRFAVELATVKRECNATL